MKKIIQITLLIYILSIFCSCDLLIYDGSIMHNGIKYYEAPDYDVTMRIYGDRHMVDKPTSYKYNNDLYCLDDDTEEIMLFSEGISIDEVDNCFIKEGYEFINGDTIFDSIKILKRHKNSDDTEVIIQNCSFNELFIKVDNVENSYRKIVSSGSIYFNYGTHIEFYIKLYLLNDNKFYLDVWDNDSMNAIWFMLRDKYVDEIYNIFVNNT